MRLCLLPVALAGCLLIPQDEHDQRLDDTDTDTDTDTDVPVGEGPVVTEIEYRFRFDSQDRFAGLWLVFKAIDEDGDLAGGRVVVTGGTSIPLSEATAFTDDRFAVALDWDVTSPCEANSQVIGFTVENTGGSASDTVSVNVDYAVLDHSEASQNSADALEPVVTVGAEHLPVIICGFKGVTNGFIDFFDEVQLFLVGQPSDVAVNYAPGSDDLGLYIFYGNDLHLSQDAAPGSGERLLFEPPATGPVYAEVFGSTAFPEANWVMFVQTQLPPVLP